MPKGKKKQKRKTKNPPLSPLNIILYWVLFALGLMLIMSPFVFFTGWQQNLGIANGAIATNGTASVLFLLIPLFPAIVVGMIFFTTFFETRTPIIGRPKSHAKPNRRHARKNTLIIAVIIAVWVLSFVPAIGAVYNRVEINETHIDTYAMFGRLAEHRPVEDATSVKVRIFYGSVSRTRSKWKMEYTVYFADGKSFKFVKAASVMFKIDALFDGLPKETEGTENFEKLCEEYDYSPDVRESLKEVFLMTD